MNVNDKFYIDQIADHLGGIAYRLREIEASCPVPKARKLKRALERAHKNVSYAIVDLREAKENFKELD